jgi:hypothetical protein
MTDTFENDVLQDRAVAQVKTFCDKGADRKSRYQTLSLIPVISTIEKWLISTDQKFFL